MTTPDQELPFDEPGPCTPEHRLCERADSCCEAPGPNGLYCCTREAGHKGPHVACGFMGHNYAAWPNQGDPSHA